ncbi:cytochrome c3 family protein [Chloroflexota bacterium]
MRNKWTKRILPFIALLLLVNLLSTSPAFASNSPHYGDILTNGDNCATCHRTQTSGLPNLLSQASNQAAFCFTCHGRDQSGANTNVQDGQYSDGKGLRGGGFEHATMDPGLTGTPSNEPVSSAHSVDNSIVRAWGGGEINSIPNYGNMITLECGDCHNPHGNGNYRMLRGLPNGMYDEDNASPVEVPNEGSVTYTITYDEITHYRDTSYAPSNLDEWCTQCHTRYSAGAESGHTQSGDAVFSFRHTTESLSGSCLRCHVAHGTTATMRAHGETVTLPDGTLNDGASDSRLLHIDNRGVCMQCHSSSTLTQN